MSILVPPRSVWHDVAVALLFVDAFGVLAAAAWFLR